MIKLNLIKSLKLNKRLLIYMILLILASCLTVGVTSYFIAKNELDGKGKVILKNGVETALLLIDVKSKEVAKGNLSLEEAQEQIKIYLLGEKKTDGTRKISSNIDLGENGYFIVYSQDGTELMHPTLEGQNVWNLVDKSKNPYFGVQDQISKAKEGGGYSFYTWNLPNSNQLGKKVSYSELDPNWGWVVTSTSYMIDYNKGAYRIMLVMILATAIMLIIGILISINFISGITKPIDQVIHNMELAEKGQYYSIIDRSRLDEIGDLVLGFNKMVQAIDSAHQNLISKEEKIMHLAYYDQLSGLPNRNMFKEHISKRVESGNLRASVVIMDIKDFKLINSVLGNEFGDEVIRVIGSVFKNHQSDENFIALINGNEFAGWIENCDEDYIKKNVDKLQVLVLEALKEIGFNQKLQFRVSYSIYPDNGVDFESCYKKATVAMNYSKENNLTDIVRFEQRMEEAIEQDSKIKNHLEEAINKEEFQVYYQNKVNIKTAKIVGVEALARWNSKALGFVSPAVFIPAIDKSNLTAKFSKMVVEKVLKDYEKLQKKYTEDITVSINISPLFFFEKDFTEFIMGAVSRSGISPEKVILEITEDVFINDFNSIRRIIEQLKSFGLRISLDDFGTGYSSLNYLKNIDFDELKIDKTFIQGMLTDEKDYKLLKSIEEIAKVYNYAIVAEGVESKEQLEKIMQSDCDIVQGYIYSKPEPV